ncbi:MAG: GntR family transcriptional regulator, partial [Erysipelotrichaceae bacterium]
MAIPKYQQIKNQILLEITKLSPNTAVESERDLSVKYSVSRMTVRKALNDLVDEGYLYRDSNKGTFIADKELRKKNTTLDKVGSLSYKTIYFDVKSTYTDEVQEHLMCRSGDNIVRMVRLEMLEGIPQTIEEIYINRTEITDQQFSDMPMWQEFSKFIKNGVLTQRFIPTLVPMKYAHLLDLKINAPIIMVENFIKDL